MSRYSEDHLTFTYLNNNVSCITIDRELSESVVYFNRVEFQY